MRRQLEPTSRCVVTMLTNKMFASARIIARDGRCMGVGCDDCVIRCGRRCIVVLIGELRMINATNNHFETTKSIASAYLAIYGEERHDR